MHFICMMLGMTQRKKAIFLAGHVSLILNFPPLAPMGY